MKASATIRRLPVYTILISITYGDRAVNEDEAQFREKPTAGYPVTNRIYLGYIYRTNGSLNSIRDIERMPIGPLPFPIHRRKERLVISHERVSSEPILRSRRAVVDDLLRCDRHVLQAEHILGRPRQAGQVNLTLVVAGIEFPFIWDVVRPPRTRRFGLRPVVEELLFLPHLYAVAGDD